MHTSRLIASGSFVAMLALCAGPAFADGGGNCSSLSNQAAMLKSALTKSIVSANGGLGNNMWGVIVDNSGIVCAVAFSGANYTSQWLGSRVIAAQKANTGNSYSLGVGSGGTVIAISSAELFSAVQPGGSLYGLQHSNPVDTAVAYGNQYGQGQGNPPAPASTFGTPQDPMVGQRIGGVNVFGGGLALYQGGVRVGGLGVSGDQSCTDHMVAWRTRNYLGLDGFTSGVSGPAALFNKDPTHPDNIIFDINANTDGTGATGQSPTGDGGVGQSASGFGHPKCYNNPTAAAVSGLPAVH
jgi:Haem-degrading